MAGATTDKLDQVTSSNTGRPVVAQLTGAGHSIAGTSVTINDATNWTTNSKIHFTIYTTTTIGSVVVKDSTSQTEWEGTLVGTTISNLVLTGGTDRAYSAGAICEITPTSKFSKDLYDHLTTQHNQDGTHKNITSTNATLTNLTVTTLTIAGSSPTGGLTPLGQNASTITYLGGRSYQMLYSGVDLTGTLSPGMKQSFIRTATAPTQCASFNGTTQFYSRLSASVAGMTFTDDFTVSGWVKLSSYPASAGIIASRWNGTSGWYLYVQSSGVVSLFATNGGAANSSGVSSYQSLSLNKWVHVTAQLDMSTFTATTTTSYVMIDGVDVPASVARTGTNPTALIQAGNLEIGSYNGGTLPFAGKIAQVAIYNAKVTQASIRATISQGLTGSETSLISAYSFNNSINDLSVNANNLTANGAVVATNADSPFSLNGTGTPTGTTDGGVITASTFSVNTTVTVQVPEGNTIPTTGGITTTYYSYSKNPFGFRDGDVWRVFDNNGWEYDSIAVPRIYRRRHTFSQAFTTGVSAVVTLAQATLPVAIATLGTHTLLVNPVANGFAGDININPEMTTSSAGLSFTGKTTNTTTFGGFIDVEITQRY